jgi:hypothetical protein
MDRGVPTEEVLAEMCTSVPPIYYLVGTPKGRLSKLEADLLECSWQRVRPGVEVKVLPQENELYVFAQSHDRLKKERAMRRCPCTYPEWPNIATHRHCGLKTRRAPSRSVSSSTRQLYFSPTSRIRGAKNYFRDVSR